MAVHKQKSKNISCVILDIHRTKQITMARAKATILGINI